MYDTCPKCNYQRQASDSIDTDICPQCGIIFSKWFRHQLQADSLSENFVTTEIRSPARALLAHLLDPGDNTDSLLVYGRILVFTLFGIWGYRFIMMDFTSNPFEIGSSFMHNINLVFHEAGHVLFRPFGWFMTIAGGSLFQLIVPLIIMLVFTIKQHDNFAASIGLWWLGQSFMDLAPYIDDALVQKLVLLGGRTGADAPGNHDWNNILVEFNRLEKARDYATIADTCGTVLMLIAFVWGGYILYRQYQIRT